MNHEVWIALIGVLGTLLAPLAAHAAAQRKDRAAWQRNQAERAFDYRRTLFRDFIAAATGFFTELRQGRPSSSSDFEALRRVNAEIQLVSPPGVVDPAQRLIQTFREMQTPGANLDLLSARWHSEMNLFIEAARRDVLQGADSTDHSAIKSAA